MKVSNTSSVNYTIPSTIDINYSPRYSKKPKIITKEPVLLKKTGEEYVETLEKLSTYLNEKKLQTIRILRILIFVQVWLSF